MNERALRRPVLVPYDCSVVWAWIGPGFGYRGMVHCLIARRELHGRPVEDRSEPVSIEFHGSGTIEILMAASVLLERLEDAAINIGGELDYKRACDVIASHLARKLAREIDRQRAGHYSGQGL